MKTQTVAALVLVTGLLTAAAFADTLPAAPVSSSPAGSASQPVPNQIVYTPQLPSVAELTRVAAAQGLTVTEIVQSATDVSLTSQAADGQVRTVSYQLLNHASQNPAQPAVVAAASPDPAYSYYYAASGVYHPCYSPYWFAPVPVRIGFGFNFRGSRRW